MVKVSIVIPTYNRASFILQAAHSVLAQTYPNFELIIIDDGSTDETAERIRQLNDARVRYIRQAHSGVSAALNAGWRAANGEFIGRVDSDDKWRPGFLERLVPILDRDPGLALVYTRAQFMDSKGSSLPQLQGTREKFPGRTLKSLLYGDFVAPMAILLRKSCLEYVGGYDESLRANEDWDLWIRLAGSFRFAYVDEVLADYRVHEQSLTNARSAENRRVLEDRVRVLEKYYSQPNLPAEAVEIRALAFRNLYQDLALRHLAAGRRREALEWYGRSIRVAPNPAAAAGRAGRDLLYHWGLGKTRLGIALSEHWVKQQSRAARQGSEDQAVRGRML